MKYLLNYCLLIILISICFVTCQTEGAKKANTATTSIPSTEAKTTKVKTPKYAGDTGIDDSNLKTVGPLKYSERTVNHSSDKDIYTISMMYPVFEGYKDEEAQNRLNKLIYHYIDKEVRTFKIYAIQNNPKGRNDLLAKCEVKKFGTDEKKIRLNFMTDFLHSNKGAERAQKPYSVLFDLESAMPQAVQDMKIPIDAKPTTKSKK